jgi:hypothetical protein
MSRLYKHDGSVRLTLYFADKMKATQSNGDSDSQTAKFYSGTFGACDSHVIPSKNGTGTCHAEIFSGSPASS